MSVAFAPGCLPHIVITAPPPIRPCSIRSKMPVIVSGPSVIRQGPGIRLVRRETVAIREAGMSRLGPAERSPARDRGGAIAAGRGRPWHADPAARLHGSGAVAD